jgi:DNA-binding XRE family transcriptional regulator
LRLGELIRKWRFHTERDLGSVAKEIGISYSTLRRVEKGEQCDSRSLSRIIAWLLAETAKGTEDADA